MTSRKDEEQNMRGKWFFIAPLAIVGMLAFMILGGYLVRGLWNWVLPPLFGWPLITFWQAVGLLGLCRVLFGGLGLHRSGHSRFRRRMFERMGERIEERLEERYVQMNPEERERFRQRLRERFGFGPSPGESRG